MNTHWSSRDATQLSRWRALLHRYHRWQGRAGAWSPVWPAPLEAADTTNPAPARRNRWCRGRTLPARHRYRRRPRRSDLRTTAAIAAWRPRRRSRRRRRRRSHHLRRRRRHWTRRNHHCSPPPTPLPPPSPPSPPTPPRPTEAAVTRVTTVEVGIVAAGTARHRRPAVTAFGRRLLRCRQYHLRRLSHRRRPGRRHPAVPIPRSPTPPVPPDPPARYYRWRH